MQTEAQILRERITNRIIGYLEQANPNRDFYVKEEADFDGDMRGFDRRLRILEEGMFGRQIAEIFDYDTLCKYRSQDKRLMPEEVLGRLVHEAIKSS